MLLFKFCFILSSFLLFVEGSLFGGLFAGKAKKEDSPVGSSDDRQKEIDAIRKEINSNSGGAPPGIVVQPDWLSSKSSESAISTKDKMSDKNMDEAASIRDEIQSAVKNNQYAAGDGGNVAEIDKLLGAQFRMKNLISTKSTANVGGGFDDEDSDDEIESTFIENFNTFEEKLKYRQRDMLYIKSIVSRNFTYGLGVDEWHSLIDNGSEVLVGVKEREIIEIIGFQVEYTFQLNSSIKQVETINLLNKTTLEMEGYIVVLTNNLIHWYRVGDDVSFWTWDLGSKKNISAVKYFKLEDDSHFLAIILGPNVIYIYSFDSFEDFLLSQKITVSSNITSLSVFNTGKDAIIVPTPLNSTSLDIYKFEMQYFENGHVRFEFFETLNFESNIEGVFDFQMGGNYYIATSGVSAKIYMYNEGTFNVTTEFSSEIGVVQMYLPIPIITFRDDLILLVQHITEFETHSLITVDSLVWDGSTFIPTLPPPCIVNNKTIHSGVSCILDGERDQGIIGATVVHEINGNITIVVPRNNVTAGLHTFNADYLERNVETLELKEIFDFLKALFYSQMKIIEEGQLFIEQNLILPDKMKVREIEIDGDLSEIGHIYINKEEWTEEDDNTDLLKLADMIEALHNELKALEEMNEEVVREKRDAPILFDEMEFDFVNVTGELTLMNPENNTFDIEALRVDGDFNAEVVNNVSWADFEKDLVRMDGSMPLDNLVVDGDIVFENELSTENLNDLSLLNDYLWMNSDSTDTIRIGGQKKFETLETNDLDTDGFINGVRPSDIITLSGDQRISGKSIFTSQLEVTEELKLTGTVRGKGLEDFLSNDDLRTTKIIKSKCQFNTLEVNGPITITKLVNGIKLDDIFENIVMKTNSSTPIIISSSKTFKHVNVEKILIENGEINDIPLMNFVSKSRPQELRLKNFSGFIVTNFLNIDGDFDGINPKEFFESVIYTNDSNSNIESNITAIFEEDLMASEFKVTENFNGHPVSDVITVDNLSEVLEEATFDNLRIETMNCECDVEGVGKLNGIDIRSAQARSLKTPSQPQHLYIDHLILKKGANVTRINSIPTHIITTFLHSYKDIPYMLKSGKLSIDTIVVKGSVTAAKINNQEFNPDNFIWLNRENIIKTHLRFRDPLYLEHSLYINGRLNNQPETFPEFLSQIAFKSEGTLTIKGTKDFLYTLRCHENVEIAQINDIPFSEIAMKPTLMEFQGNLVIKGDVHINKLNVGSHLNDHFMAELPNLCRFDTFLNSWVFGGPLVFKGHITIDNLILRKGVNDVEDLDELLNSLTYTNQISVLKGKTIFKNEVKIMKGGYIKHINGFDLMDVLNNMVFIAGSNEIKISGPVSFGGPVSATHITVKRALITEKISGCDVNEWVENTVNVNEDVKVDGPIKFKESTLDGNSFYIKTLNECPFENFLTLNTPQNFTGNLAFSTVYVRESLSVQQNFNGLDVKNLPYERNNTLMKNYEGFQYVENTLTIPGPFEVQQNLDIETGYININKNLEDILNLDGNIEIVSPVWIGNVSVDNVHTNDFISGIDIKDWEEASFVRNKKEQIVTGNWTFHTLETVLMSGNDTINGMSMKEFLLHIRQIYNANKEELMAVLKAVRTLCEKNGYKVGSLWESICVDL
ncbi:hypothetical protein ACFFRR_002445 [Megaselia abdita]